MSKEGGAIKEVFVEMSLKLYCGDMKLLLSCCCSLGLVQVLHYILPIYPFFEVHLGDTFGGCKGC
jgi:hypothetical protein